MEERFTITNTTKSTEHQKWCSVPFDKIKNLALGKSYSLSLVFIGKTTSQRLNKTYRGKNKPTNILSFPLDKKMGEIFITPSIAKKELSSLFIHGLMHLKGHTHGDTMDRAEEKLRKQFSV